MVVFVVTRNNERSPAIAGDPLRTCFSQALFRVEELNTPLVESSEIRSIGPISCGHVREFKGPVPIWVLTVVDREIILGCVVSGIPPENMRCWFAGLTARADPVDTTECLE